jgi:hypothetical protein
MREDTPAVYLLAGPAGPAKAAYVQTLIDHGVVEVPPGPASQVSATLVAHLQSGRDVFLDQEQIAPEDRDGYASLIEEHGGQWCLITFSVDHTPLATRLAPSDPTAAGSLVGATGPLTGAVEPLADVVGPLADGAGSVPSSATSSVTSDR